MVHMNKTGLRRIKVEGEVYLWKRKHFHLAQYNSSPCVEKLTVFLDGYKNSPLELFFRQEDNALLQHTSSEKYWCVGYPNDGVIWLFQGSGSQDQNKDINLNRPGVVAKLILHHLGKGWNPQKSKKPYAVKDALKLLEQIDLPLGLL